MVQPTYARYPDVRDDEILFIADNDVWLAPLAGGKAQRLTNDLAPARHPLFSPDGTRIAWTSYVAGTPDVYVLTRATGDIRRVTWWGDRACRAVAWQDDSTLVVASEWRLHRQARLYAVDLDGDARLLPYGPAQAIAWGPDGRIAISTSDGPRDASAWKRYRGGTAPQLWLHVPGSDANEWRRVLPDEPAVQECPGWFGDRLFFISDLAAGRAEITDPTAQANLYSVDASGGDLTQHTHHTEVEGYVRGARTDGRTIVYHAHGHLYALDSLESTPRPIEVDLALGAPAPHPADPHDLVERVVPDERATGSVVAWRGAAFYLTHRSGPARVLADTPGVRVREPQVLGDRGLAVVVTDAEGDDALEVSSLIGGAFPVRVAGGKLGYVLSLVASPDGEAVAVGSHDGAVYVVDLSHVDPRATDYASPGDGESPTNADAGASSASAASQAPASSSAPATQAPVPQVPVPQVTVRQVGRSDEGEVTGLTWSPDGRYLVWRQSRPFAEGAIGQLMAADLAAHDADPAAEITPIALTSGSFDDADPAFTRDGKYLVWLSSRTFDPHYDDHGFDLAFNASTRPWISPLSADEPAPFGVQADGWPFNDEADDRPAATASPASASGTASAAGASVAAPSDSVEADEPTIACRIDVDGFEERMIPFPVVSGNYGQLRAVKDGVVWLRALGYQGVIGSARAGAGEGDDVIIERFSFATRRCEQIVDRADSFEVSGDGERLVVKHKDEITVVPSDRRSDDDDPSTHVTVDLTRMRRRINPRDEWRQMFDENGRLMRLHFWREDMDGVDWDAVLARYRPLVETLRSSDDLADVLWETVAELNTSHAYVSPRPQADADLQTGFLGADLGGSFPGGVVIDRVIPGETSDPKAWSPLRAAGVDVRDGDILVAIDGRLTSEAPSVGSLLEGAAGKAVELTVFRPPVGVTVSAKGPAKSPSDGDGVVEETEPTAATAPGATTTAPPTASDQVSSGSSGAGSTLVATNAMTTSDCAPHVRRVAVVPLASEQSLRYQDWVASRAAYVKEHTDDRLGYVHVPDMMSVGWAQLHRRLAEASRHEGVVLDVRHNAGGHTSQLVIERFLRRVVGWEHPRHIATSEPYPAQAMRGPVVVVTDRWAGSDGDIVNAAAQALGLTVVGERTWGGVVGIDGRFSLVDGTEVTQPRYAGWYSGYGWGVENHGVEPDVTVTLTPPEWDGEADLFLDTAIAILLRRLEETPAATPPELDPPRFAVTK
ncbi:MAG: PDZ domain-containing protein [Propionibacteriaceae bacterium]|jgi:tricorn protease|nr:PDZ domain-containing protein [Propionibacteriaceae bacterium]